MSKAKSSLGLKDGQWVVEVKGGKIVRKANLHDASYMVLNDNETFTGFQGCSVWGSTQKADEELDTTDFEQIFKGNEETDEVKCLFRF